MTCATSGRRIESQHAPPPSSPSSPPPPFARPGLRLHYVFASCRPLHPPAPSGQADGTNAHRARGRMRQPARAARRTSVQLRTNGGRSEGPCRSVVVSKSLLLLLHGRQLRHAVHGEAPHFAQALNVVLVPSRLTRRPCRRMALRHLRRSSCIHREISFPSPSTYSASFF